PPPLLVRRVAEAVLDEGIVARQPHEQGEEIGRRDHDREPAGSRRAERAEDDEGRSEAERYRPVHAGEGDDPPPGEPEVPPAALQKMQPTRFGSERPSGPVCSSVERSGSAAPGRARRCGRKNGRSSMRENPAARRSRVTSSVGNATGLKSKTNFFLV